MSSELSNAIMAVSAVINIIVVGFIFYVSNKFQGKLNEENRKFQMEMYNLNFKSYWMHDIVYEEFKQGLEYYDNACIQMIDTCKAQDEINAQYTPIQKNFMEELKVFEMFSEDLKIKIRDLITDLEDIITDITISIPKRRLALRRNRVKIINLIFEFDCDLHEFKK